MRKLARIGRAVVLGLALLPLASAVALSAAPWPTRPIKIIVPYPAGDLSDIFARLISAKLAKAFGQLVLVENRPGGNSIIGSQAVAQADPDGYTLLVADAALSINPALVRNLPFDPATDFTPVIHLGESYDVVVVKSDVPVRTLSDLVEAGKARPGDYAVAVPGFGTSHRVALEQLKGLAGINLVTVPFRGSLPAINNVLAGHVPIGIDSLVPLAPHLRKGTVRALAVLGEGRAETLPDTPSAAEAGLPELTTHSYNVLVAPAGTPKPIINDINTTVNAILQQPETIERARVLGLRLRGGSPEKARSMIRDVSRTYARLIEATDMKAE